MHRLGGVTMKQETKGRVVRANTEVAMDAASGPLPGVTLDRHGASARREKVCDVRTAEGRIEVRVDSNTGPSLWRALVPGERLKVAGRKHAFERAMESERLAGYDEKLPVRVRLPAAPPELGVYETVRVARSRGRLSVTVARESDGRKFRVFLAPGDGVEILEAHGAAAAVEAVGEPERIPARAPIMGRIPSLGESIRARLMENLRNTSRERGDDPAVPSPARVRSSGDHPSGSAGPVSRHPTPVRERNDPDDGPVFSRRDGRGERLAVAAPAPDVRPATGLRGLAAPHSRRQTVFAAILIVPVLWGAVQVYGGIRYYTSDDPLGINFVNPDDANTAEIVVATIPPAGSTTGTVAKQTPASDL